MMKDEYWCFMLLCGFSLDGYVLGIVFGIGLVEVMFDFEVVGCVVVIESGIEIVGVLEGIIFELLLVDYLLKLIFDDDKFVFENFVCW